MIYRRNDRKYALGVCNHIGEIKVDEIFQIEIPKTVHFTLWGEYQRVGWTVRDILKLLSWRIQLMETPRIIQAKDIINFEKSRWMLFAFWVEDVDRLVQLEIKLMFILFKIHGQTGGNLKQRILNDYKFNEAKEMEEYLKHQYQTKFAFNDVEVEFIQSQGWFGKHIKSLIKGSTLGNI
jgi:hypothetical protein